MSDFLMKDRNRSKQVLLIMVASFFLIFLGIKTPSYKIDFNISNSYSLCRSRNICHLIFLTNLLVGTTLPNKRQITFVPIT